MVKDNRVIEGYVLGFGGMGNSSDSALLLCCFLYLVLSSISSHCLDLLVTRDLPDPPPFPAFLNNDNGTPDDNQSS